MAHSTAPNSASAAAVLSKPITIGIVGYGEVGKIFGADLRALAPATSGITSLTAWDLKFEQPDSAAAQRAHAGAAGIYAAQSIADLCQRSALIISAVTASNTLAVAQALAPAIQRGTVVLDLNSASPGTKQQCATLIDAAGAHYVEAGVMTSVPPYRLRVPMLLGGAQAPTLAERLQAWGMDARAVSDQLGIASAIKMCRSVMIKGLEALVIESYSTARAYGVEQYVLPTLMETFPSIDWDQQGAYFFSRVVQHGQRRSEEMFEAANTVREAGFDPTMATAIALKQQTVAKAAAQGVFAAVPKAAPWQAYADAALQARTGHKPDNDPADKR